MKLYRILVRKDGEWGDFFVHEYDPVSEPRNGQDYKRYAATWTCYSSYGTFGHHWYSMGSPLPEFMQDVDSGYLLGKISQRKTSGDVAVASLRRTILQGRYDGRWTKDVCREAWDTIDSLVDETTSDEALCHLLYQNVNLPDFDWDISSQEHPISARQFANLIWPEFVKAMKERNDQPQGSDSNCVEQATA